MNLNLINENLFYKGKNNSQLNNEIEILDDTILWIDPLDGTLSYIKNELEAVTNMIGLSSNKRPVLGLIA